ncbi:MAG: glycoside hydrolase family 15 protein [Bacteroidales bacterium]|nr:glycoside hydrolase family 15 protein [Bacteroidales bacterium]MBN2634181.1 glycoside hydrolase family 15 protein [Bacteroidales bacterium]
MRKYNIGVIGNCSYLAYIDTDANVNWLCMPRFDSSFIFGSLLDRKKGGEFSIKPGKTDYKSRQYYLKNTNILATEFEMPEGRFRVVDFAPRFVQYDRYFRPLMLFRKIELLEGDPYIVVKCNPVDNYGKRIPETVMGSNHIRYLNLSTNVRLTTDIPLNYITKCKPFLLNKTQYLVFSYGAPLEAPLSETSEQFLNKTQRYWVNWVKSTSIPWLYQDEVIRSALVLKLHQYEDTGAVIASGSTSLPEIDQAHRNWDYRFCWMRDTYYTLNAFNNIGHFEELEKYFDFIRNIILSEKNQIKPLYTISGDPVPDEKILLLEGYLKNKPVRIGNNATYQVQNDVYGQILVSLLPLFIDKRLNYIDLHQSEIITGWLLNCIEENMDIPDSGPWEFGTTNQFHCYTYLFHWAGCSAAAKIGASINNNEISGKAIRLKERAQKYIEDCYSPDRKAYMQSVGNKNMDAGNLQLITMNYLNPNSGRAIQHLKALEEELFSIDNIFLRYKHDDLGNARNTFIICGFWYAEALAAIGMIDKAFRIIETLIKTSNHLGLFSEDADENFGQWGNFPQTYSHVGLVNAVYRLSTKIDKPIFQ